MQYNMNQNQLMQMMVMQALRNISPELLAKVEEEARKRGMSEQDISVGKDYILHIQQEGVKN